MPKRSGLSRPAILKCECIYRKRPQTRAQAGKMIDAFIWFYNYVRLQTATGMPPLAMRIRAVS
ncbi:MAG: IS3 family transposase [Oscillospiraceae bacterium]